MKVEMNEASEVRAEINKYGQLVIVATEEFGYYDTLCDINSSADAGTVKITIETREDAIRFANQLNERVKLWSDK